MSVTAVNKKTFVYKMFHIQVILCKSIKLSLCTCVVPSGVATLDQFVVVQSGWSDKKA